MISSFLIEEMAAANRRRKPPVSYVKDRELSRENLKTCGLLLIKHVLEEFNKDQNKLRAHVNEILHAIFFLGIIHDYHLTPNDFLPKALAESVKETFPDPFEKYNTHLPKRTPFSVLLDIMELRYNTTNRVLTELCSLLEKLKFPYPLGKNGNKNQNFYTLESTVICVCFNDSISSRTYFGASLGCRTEKAKSIMIYSSCINTWHKHVSHVVMSFTQQNDGDSLQFPKSMKCQAYSRNWTENTYEEKQPCGNCQQLFSLPGEGTGREHYPYGNCAETECLSKLLFNDQFMEKNVSINYTYDDVMLLESTKQRLKEKLASISSLRSMMINNVDPPLFNP